MINLKTNCDKCIHEHVCKNRNNAKMFFDRLKNTNFGDGPNDDYDWDVMSSHYSVNIDISCPTFKPNNGGFR